MKKKSVAAYIDLIVCSIVVIVGFIGAKIILFDLLDGTFNKEFNDTGIVMVGIFILGIVVFGMQIPKTIKELKNKWNNRLGLGDGLENSSRTSVGHDFWIRFLNHSMGIYDNFWNEFGVTTNYKSVALPIELWGRKKFFIWKYQIKQAQ